jgi:hypothetical protein
MKYIVYGVTLIKMRKILTVRTPFVFYNKTLFVYEIEIVERNTGREREKIELNPDKKYPINFEYYENCDLKIRITLENDYA